AREGDRPVELLRDIAVAVHEDLDLVLGSLLIHAPMRPASGREGKPLVAPPAGAPCAGPARGGPRWRGPARGDPPAGGPRRSKPSLSGLSSDLYLPQEALS